MADNNDDLAAQLALMNKINAVVQTIAGNAQKVKSSYAAQFELAQKMLQIVNQISNVNPTGVGNLNEKLSETAQQMESLNSDPFEKLAQEALGASGSVGKLSNNLFKTVGRLTVFGAVLGGVVKGFKNVIGLTKGVFGFLKGIADLAFSATAALISIPFRILGGLVDMAASSQGSSELRREIEKVREAFGDLKGPAASAIIDTTKNLEGFSATGLSAYRIFGNLAERLKTVREVAMEMGATFDIFKQEFKENGGAVLAYQKGLGISNEQMKALSARAITTGKTMSKVMNDMTKQTLTLGKAFGIDQKLIGKEMAAAIKDVKNFGQVSVKEIGVAAVYARKLGVELDKITGTLGAFETFDQAAENSAKLSQSFGVQIDAFKMMEAQNPAEQVDMLRQQFKAAGIDSANFNRQQRKLLATSTGLDEAVVQQVFAAKNYGVSLNDIQKKSEVAEKKQLSQAEAMSKLADSIERLVKDGPKLQSSFFDMFMQGIDRGIKRSPEFMRLMRNIRQALRVTMMAGVALGRIFVEKFAGVKDVIGGLADVFGPSTFGKLGERINNAFKLLADKKIDFNQFATSIFGAFGQFFEDEKGPMKKVLDGLKKFFIRIADLAGPAIAWAGERIGESMSWLADVISGRKSLPGMDTSGPMSFLDRFLAPLIEGFKKAGPKIALGASELFDAIMAKIVKKLQDPKVQEAGKKALMGLAAMIFGPAVMDGVTAFIISVLAKSLASSLLSSIGKALFTAEAGSKSLITRAFSSIGSSIMSAASAVGTAITTTLTGAIAGGLAIAASAVAAGGYLVNDSFNTYGKELEKNFGESNARFAAGIASFVGIFTTDETEKSVATFFAKMGSAIDLEGEGVLGTMAKHVKLFGASVADTLNMYGAWITGKDITEKKINEKKLSPPPIPKGPTAPSTADKALQDLQKLAPNIDITANNFGDKLTNTTEQIMKAHAAIGKIKQMAPMLQRAINEGGVKTALDSIKDVVAMVQKLDEALAVAPTVDVAAKLERLASASGLGTKASYQVKSKEVVINLNLNITMDVDKVEKVMIMRKESIIRDRLNFATVSNPGSQASQEIPETYSERVPKTTRR